MYSRREDEDMIDEVDGSDDTYMSEINGKVPRIYSNSFKSPGQWIYPFHETSPSHHYSNRRSSMYLDNLPNINLDSTPLRPSNISQSI